MLANELGSDQRSAAFDRALGSGSITECGDVAARALAGALERADASGDPQAIDRFIFPASHNRHPEILAAAIRLARDRGSSAAARILGLEVMLRQHDVSTTIDGLPSGLASEPPPPDPFCVFDFVLHSRYLSETPLPADYESRIIAAAATIAADPSEPESVRYVARCVRVEVAGEWRR